MGLIGYSEVWCCVHVITKDWLETDPICTGAACDASSAIGEGF